MPHRFLLPVSLRLPRVLLAVLTLAASAFPRGAAHAQTTATVTDIYDFDSSPDGYNLSTPLVESSNGNFFGLTTSGGANNAGTVFQLTLAGDLTPFYSFDTDDGPLAFIQASDGNFYGATNNGELFQLTPAGVFTTLTIFAGTVDADCRALVQTSDGTLYGTTENGGPYNAGTVFKAVTSPALPPPVPLVVLPAVTIAVAGDGEAVEGGERGKAVVYRTGDTSAALDVNYKVKGSAKAGVNYQPVTGVVTIPAGASKAKIKIKPIDNMTDDGTLVAKIRLRPSTTGSYVLDSAAVAKIVVIDND